MDLAERDRLRGAFWRLLFEALMRHLRFHTRGSRGAERADLEDVSSETALELLARAESGAWSLDGRSASEISGYISQAARFAWIDFQQRRGRENRSLDPVEGRSPEDQGGAWFEGTDRTLGSEIVTAIRDCMARLPARGRRVWFFRTYFGMSGREIAQHPLVQIKAPHVDVLAQRTRAALRDCLRTKGTSMEDLPRGVFVELWDLLESLAEQEKNAWEPGFEGGNGDA